MRASLVLLSVSVLALCGCRTTHRSASCDVPRSHCGAPIECSTLPCSDVARAPVGRVVEDLPAPTPNTPEGMNDEPMSNDSPESAGTTDDDVTAPPMPMPMPMPTPGAGEGATEPSVRNSPPGTTRTATTAVPPVLLRYGTYHRDGDGAIVEVDLSETEITDVAVRTLGGLPALRSLDLSGTRVNGSFLAGSGFESLEFLMLSGTDINDGVVPSLKRLRRLRGLDLDRTAVTDSGIEKLRAALPDCRIYATPRSASASGSASNLLADRLRDEQFALEIARMLTERNDWAGVATVLEPLAARPGASDTLRIRLAIAHARSGNMQAAAPILERVVGRDEAERRLAVLEYEARIAEARRAMTNRLAHLPDGERMPRFNLAVIEERSNEEEPYIPPTIQPHGRGPLSTPSPRSRFVSEPRPLSPVAVRPEPPKPERDDRLRHADREFSLFDTPAEGESVRTGLFDFADGTSAE